MMNPYVKTMHMGNGYDNYTQSIFSWPLTSERVVHIFNKNNM